MQNDITNNIVEEITTAIDDSILNSSLIPISDAESQKRISDIVKSIYESLVSQWPNIDAIISKDAFIGWGHPGIAENCFRYAFKQLENAGFRAPFYNYKSNRLLLGNQIYQIYATESGININETFKAVNYIKGALVNNIPVLCGIDDKIGSPNGDETTDHFIVIVGMGKDFLGPFFRFFDNASSDANEGTDHRNLLHLDEVSLGLFGHSFTTYGNRGEYQLSQVRVSIPI